MATQKERRGNWKGRGLDKRDFQHDHSGPEEMPHRPKRDKNKGAPKGDHKHIYDTNGWEKKYHARYDAERGGYFCDWNRWYWIRKYECLECGKRGDYHYRWQTSKPDN